MSRRAVIFIPILLFTGLTLVFFYRLAFTDLILARGDTYHYFYPLWDVRDAALRDGTLPLWTTDLYMGAPLLADPQLGTLYPPNWLTIPLDAPQSIKVSILLHVTWAALGAYWLARRGLGLAHIPALVAGAIFALGGHLGAHVEQINQLQGLSWLPWLFLLYILACERPRRYLPLMGAAWAMQLLSGHTQTAFITGVGLGIYWLADAVIPPRAEATRLDKISPVNRTRLEKINLRTVRFSVLALLSSGALARCVLLLIAALLGILLALPQLIPTQELIALSNRGGGFSVQEATAFSLNPALIGRGLLPSYDGQPFGEYVGYIGVIGLGLAVIGATDGDRRRWPWLILALVGLVFALGRYTPVYLLLANLPGFDLFRVPARWLALVALAGAMLAGRGVQRLSTTDERLPLTPLAITTGLVIVLALSTLLADRAADEVDGPALPDLFHWIAWSAALLVVISVWLTPPQTPPQSIGEGLNPFPIGRWVPTAMGKGWAWGIALLVVVELFIASWELPYNDLSDPAAYSESRFSIDLMRVVQGEGVVPGRLLSISGLLFDPGDKPALERRWDDLGLTRRASDYAFTATKLKEIIAPNLPLTWGIASIDGFGGGVLPTAYYTRFTSLMLPEGTPPSVDGRLREVLAEPECYGACVPPDALLDLTNTRYLLVDKVYDRVHEGIFYDTALIFPPDGLLDNPRQFEGDALYVLVTPPPDPLSVVTGSGSEVTFIYTDGEEAPLTLDGDPALLDEGGLTLLRFGAETARIPQAVRLNTADGLTIRAATLVDRRTDAHVQLAPPGWQRIYSADIKIYENLDVLPRAFVVHSVATVLDDEAGDEAALNILRQADPRQAVTLHRDVPMPAVVMIEPPPSTVRITEYTATRVVIEVDAGEAGWLFMSDGYYPGWQAVDQDGEEREIIRADVMFRAVPVERGQQTLTLTFAPGTVSTATLAGGLLLWLVLVGVQAVGWWNLRFGQSA